MTIHAVWEVQKRGKSRLETVCKQKHSLTMIHSSANIVRVRQSQVSLAGTMFEHWKTPVPPLLQSTYKCLNTVNSLMFAGINVCVFETIPCSLRSF